MSTYNLSERTDRASLRRAGHGGRGIADIERVRSRGAIPLADLAAAFDEFNRGVERARRSYYGRGYHDRQIARSEATKRSAARKKGASK